MHRILHLALGATLLLGGAGCVMGESPGWDLGLDFGLVSVGETHLDGTLEADAFDDVVPDLVLLFVDDDSDSVLIPIEEDRAIAFVLRGAFRASENRLDEARTPGFGCIRSCPVDVLPDALDRAAPRSPVTHVTMDIAPADDGTSEVTYTFDLADGSSLTLRLRLAHDEEGWLASFP